MSRIRRKVKVVVIVENTVRSGGLLGEHGLCFLVDTGAHMILFDTGQGMALIHNAEKLAISLDKASAVVLSHGHYDHSGGLGRLLKLIPDVKVYAHRAAFDSKFKCDSDGRSHHIGIPLVRQSHGQMPSNLVFTEKPTEIAEGIYVTGEIPRQNDFEDTGGAFFLDKGCSLPDPLVDDQALFFDTQEGAVVLLGCAHSGVINTLQYIQEIIGSKQIYSVIGGMHLVNASDARLEKTFEALERLAVRHMAPGHCTGLKAIVQLWSRFPGKCSPCEVGSCFVFD